LIQELPLIFREKGSGTRQTMEAYIQKNELQVNKKMELTSNEAVKQAIIAGLGYSIMPLIGTKNELQDREIQIISIKGMPIKTTWRLIWLKGKKHSPISLAYIDYLKRINPKLLKTNLIGMSSTSASFFIQNAIITEWKYLLFG